jgi:ABC-type lipoprotein release transport system permease subunit
MGIVPEHEKKVSELGTFYEGRQGIFDHLPDPREPTVHPGVVLGAELRGGSGTVGLLTARHSTTPILCVKDFEVVGRMRSGMVEYDSSYIFMDLAAAQQFLQVDDPRARTCWRSRSTTTTSTAGRCASGSSRSSTSAAPATIPRTTARDLRLPLRPVPDDDVGAVEARPAPGGRGGEGDAVHPLSLIVLVAGFNIVAIYTLVVRAKTRDIGILRALGGTEGGVTSIFLMSGGLCGLFGSIFGIVLGLLLALNLNEILDFIRVVSREMNRMGLVRATNFFERSSTVIAWATLLLALLALVWNWLALYKERRPHPWVRMISAALLLTAAAWFSTKWMVTYTPHDHYDADFTSGSRVVFTLGTAAAWILFCGAWRFLDRYRRRPSWIFFGFASTLFMSAAFLVVFSTLAIATGILARQPDFAWPGLELFSRQIYYLDRVPVFVDYGALVYIVIWTLFVSLCCSVYPALRAAAANPVEAIRDE